MSQQEDPIIESQKLTVVCRVEPGCLGPDGKQYIEEFCELAHRVFMRVNPEHILWDIIPRYDKTMPEIQYKFGERILTSAQADRYLQVCHLNLTQFEEQLNSLLTKLIDHHLNRE